MSTDLDQDIQTLPLVERKLSGGPARSNDSADDDQRDEDGGSDR